MLARSVSIASGLVLLLGAAFGLGIVVTRYELPPYPAIYSAWQAAKSLAAHGEVVPAGRRVPAPSGAARARMTLHDPDAINGGYYAVAGWDGEARRYSAWLFDSTGKRRHVWPLDYGMLDPEHALAGAENPHAFYVLPDGSVLVAFDDGRRMARLDACGAPIWTKDGVYHHSLSRADDGTFWTWRAADAKYGHYQYLENFDPRTGRTLREIGLVEDLIQRLGPSAAVFGVRPDYPFELFHEPPANPATVDIFHPNDVEALPLALAPKFPMFEAGDLMLSLRNINLVAVVDPDTAEVKWWRRGPWIGQHDPDFLPDGTISVYNNNSRRHRSEIIRIDPATDRLHNDLFHGDVFFYSEYMGKHHYLPNGNVLIVVPGEGRVLEVTDNGRLVLEFNNLAPGASAAHYNEHVENAMWLPADYFDVGVGSFDVRTEQGRERCAWQS